MTTTTTTVTTTNAPAEKKVEATSEKKEEVKAELSESKDHTIKAMSQNVSAMPSEPQTPYKTPIKTPGNEFVIERSKTPSKAPTNV
jgi:hypothetical protein